LPPAEDVHEREQKSTSHVPVGGLEQRGANVESVWPDTSI
jgi:hypothetical protein